MSDEEAPSIVLVLYPKEVQLLVAKMENKEQSTIDIIHPRSLKDLLVAALPACDGLSPTGLECSLKAAHSVSRHFDERWGTYWNQK